MNSLDLVSVVVTTKNEEKNIDRCLRSIQLQTWKAIETIVVDNASTDKTKDRARLYTPLVFDKGPERSAQRNFGMLEKARGRYAMYVDADMVLSPGLVEACVERMRQGDVPALHVPEIVLGRSFWGRVRRFERGFYDGTVIDGARFFDRGVLCSVGGFDETLSGPEDWDLDKKIKQKGSIALLRSQDDLSRKVPEWELGSFVRERGGPAGAGDVIFHNEADFSLGRYLRKKSYYAGSFDGYLAKWGKNDPDLRRQLGGGYRYITVFLEKKKWTRVVRHPVLFAGMFFLRFLVGGVFIGTLLKRKGRIGIGK